MMQMIIIDKPKISEYGSFSKAFLSTMYTGKHDGNIVIWRRRYSDWVREIAEKEKQ